MIRRPELGSPVGHARVAAGGGIDHSRRGETMSRPKLLALLGVGLAAAALAEEPRPLAMVIHGGAGVIDPAKMTPEPGPSYRAGTVGAVALDGAGHLAAATSTGGLTDKHRGRVGDSPIIGAGTYADEACAVSGTGQGEFFIRQVVAYDLCALMEYRHLTVGAAVREVIHEKLRRTGGEGGVIALDRNGNIAMDFNSVGMFRAARDSRGRRDIAMYRDAR